MYLLRIGDNGDISLTDDLLERDIPPYATLSHTWGSEKDEVTFKDVKKKAGLNKLGYEKIRFCAAQAARDGLQHIWVDTCCIDKRNLTEVSEAIVSMFRWYRNAAKCYVYLTDVPVCPGESNQEKLTWALIFQNSRWFRRGWTLQELIAPQTVQFFSNTSEHLGDKQSLEDLIQNITRIPAAALQGTPLSLFTTEQRMSWITNRDTKKKEDRAYCLLGIFDVSMPIIYGEGEGMAFKRLEDVVQQSRNGTRTSKSQSPASTVPFRRDRDFIDRGTLLQQIAHKCGQTAARVVLVGIGGVGKSQLAIEYCHRLRDQSPKTWVFWVYASSVDRIEQGYRAIAEATKLPGRTDPQANIFELVTGWLQDEQNGPWLMVLDNIDDEAVLTLPCRAGGGDNQERPLSDFIPESRNGTVLVTSRTKRVALKLVELSDVVPIEPMIESEAMGLIDIKMGNKTNEQDSQKLARLLEFMPLAIVQATAYIQQRAPRYSLQQYIDDFQESDQQGTSLLDHEAGHLRRDKEAKNSIILTWQISFDYIRQQWPSTAELLSLMSFFDRQGIPDYVIEARYLDKVEDVPELQDDENKSDQNPTTGFEDDLGRLRDYMLVSVEADGHNFTMHSLIQIATRRWLTMEAQDRKWRAIFLWTLNQFLPTGAFEHWTRCEALFPHAKSAEKQKPSSEGNSQSLLDWAQILRNAGWYARARGHYNEAERMCLQSVEVLTESLGSENIETLYSMSNLASTYWNQGRWKEAEELEVQVMETRKTVLGKEHPDTLTSMANLASTYWNQGRWKEAEELGVQVMETRKTVLGKEHPDTLTSIANLASTYWSQGRWKEAEELDVQVMETSLTVLGKEHPDTLTSMANLALTYQNQGRWKEAEELEVQLMKTRKTVLGKEHPNTLTSMANLASTYQNQGRWKEAEELDVQAMKTRKTVLGKEHPDTLTSMANLASIYQNQGRWKEAEELEVQVMETGKTVLGKEHPSTLTSMANLASTYWNQGRWKEAEELEVQVMKTRKTVLGKEHPDTLTSMANLAYTLWDQGRAMEAFELMSECVKSCVKVLGPADHRTERLFDTLRNWERRMAEQLDEALAVMPGSWVD